MFMFVCLGIVLGFIVAVGVFDFLGLMVGLGLFFCASPFCVLICVYFAICFVMWKIVVFCTLGTCLPCDTCFGWFDLICLMLCAL